MAYVPINRTRALIICTHPQDYAPARLRLAARYLLDRPDTTEEERRLATEAIEWLRSKRRGEGSARNRGACKPDQSREQQALMQQLGLNVETQSMDWARYLHARVALIRRCTQAGAVIAWAGPVYGHRIPPATSRGPA